MAQTPEAKVKARVRKILDEMGIYHFMPPANGFLWVERGPLHRTVTRHSSSCSFFPRRATVLRSVAGMIPASMILATVVPASSIRPYMACSVRFALGLGRRRTMIFVTRANVPSEPQINRVRS